MKIKALLPWWAKIFAKLILSRMPFNYHVWQRVDLFKHGGMERPEYAYDVFTRHFERFNPGRLRKLCVALELGCGDSLASAVLAPAFDIDKMYLVDSGAFARDDMGPYLEMASFMESKGLKAPDLSQVRSLADFLGKCNASYFTEGISSLRKIPTGSVDFVFSQAVLEHVRKAEFIEMTREMRRIIKSDGVCSHSVDLKDHLGGALNNLRFSEPLWESDFMAESGFYTNRIRFEDMLDIFSKEGFWVDIISVERWRELPTPRSSLSKEFRNLPDEQLLVSDFEVVLRPRH